ncbi:hypothetical protein LWI29_006276 [Acer saccharum]|uniref:Uncharacterized protein n=1 Tax=Acer saccharum TaxID=4024 RepID=A0AA39RIB1_ACESA|nr:hypothetical protein LWI29_006276 [Acer saccharum]
MCCFEEFDRRDKPMIEFELILVPNDVEFPIDLLAWKEGFIGENVPPPEENMQHNGDEPVKDVASQLVEDAANEAVEDAANEAVEDAASDEFDASSEYAGNEPVEDAASDEFDKSEDDNYEVYYLSLEVNWLALRLLMPP